MWFTQHYGEHWDMSECVTAQGQLYYTYTQQKKEHWGAFQCKHNRDNMSFKDWIEYELYSSKTDLQDDIENNANEYDIDHDWQDWVMKLEDVFMRL